MVTTQELIRQVARNTGGYIESVTTSVGSTTADVNDTQLANFTPDANAFRGKWWQALSAQNVGEVRRITASTTTDLAIVAASVATPVGTRYAIFDYSPENITAAINDAIRESYDDLYEHVTDESIIIDDLGSNGSFEKYKRGLILVAASIAGATTQSDNFWADGAVLIMEFTPYSDGENDTARLISKQDVSDDDGWRVNLRGEAGGFMALDFDVTHLTTDGVWRSESTFIPIRKRQTIALSWNAADIDNDPILYHAIEDEPLRRVGFTRVAIPVGAIDSDSGNNLYMGDSVASDGLFDGVFGAVQMWDQEHSQEEIQGFIDHPPLGVHPNLLGHWPMRNENIFTSVFDTSGFSNDAAITGSVFVSNFDDWIYAGTSPNSVRTGRALNESVHGKFSVVVTAAAGGANEIRQYIDTQQASGTVLIHKRWVRADAASSARIGIGGTSGVTDTFSDFHTGDAQWTLLSVDYTLTDDDIDLYLICETAVSLTGYFGLGFSKIDKLHRYPLPDGMRSVAYVQMQEREERPSGEFVSLNGISPRSGALLRLEGKRPLPSLEASSDVLPLEDRYVHALVEKASEKLMGYAAARAQGDTRDELRENEATHRAKYADMMANPQQRMKRLGAEIGKNWHIEGEVLVLEETNVPPVFVGAGTSKLSAGIG